MTGVRASPGPRAELVAGFFKVPFDMARSINALSATYATLLMLVVASVGAMTYNPLGSVSDAPPTSP